MCIHAVVVLLLYPKVMPQYFQDSTSILMISSAKRVHEYILG